MKVLTINITFTSLAALFVALRLWTRFRLIRAPGLDDILIFAALLSSFTFFAFMTAERHYGLGDPLFSLHEDEVRGQLFYLWLSVPFYNLCLILAKLSALWLLIRIFRSSNFLRIAYILMAFIVISGLWIVISGFAFCIPVSDFWNLNRNIHERHCLPEGPIWYSNAAMQIFTDVIILILPMPWLWKLRLPTRQKMGVMLVFSVGIFVIATSSARLYELSVMVRAQDFTKRNAEAAVWSSIEANVSIICVCLPPLQPLLSRIFALCFLPQPLRSSPGSKSQLTSTNLTESRKHSVYDHGANGGVFVNDVFYSGPGRYSASISRVNTNEDEPEAQDGIRVVRELRLSVGTAAAANLPPLESEEQHFEMADRDSGKKTEETEVGRRNRGIEWDLGNFEFPDYKERLNAPI